MIGKLRGLLDGIEGDAVLIDVGGVFYLCHCPTRTIAGLPGRGQGVELYVETVVREDMIRLFGFLTLVEKQWFNLLMTVQGVGTRVALGVLSVLSPGELASAIALEDRAAVARAPGVGPKVALRIVTELKGKTPLGAIPVAGIAGLAAAMGNGAAAGPAADAVSALVHLGYPHLQAAMAVAKALAVEGEGAATEALIKAGLKELSG
ncbi:MAG: Holliday junction branch migration protein RuvA [Cucumibacter sp.]